MTWNNYSFIVYHRNSSGHTRDPSLYRSTGITINERKTTFHKTITGVQYTLLLENNRGISVCMSIVYMENDDIFSIKVHIESPAPKGIDGRSRWELLSGLCKIDDALICSESSSYIVASDNRSTILPKFSLPPCGHHDNVYWIKFDCAGTNSLDRFVYFSNNGANWSSIRILPSYRKYQHITCTLTIEAYAYGRWFWS